MLINASSRRIEILQSLEKTTYDLLIIGGGATGIGCALEAVLRGLQVLLIEARDFGSGASTSSTKLLHGGVRYLESAIRNLDKFQLALVKEALQERKILLQSVDWITRPLPIIIPTTQRYKQWYYYVGLWIYEQLSGKQKLQPPQLLKSQQMQELAFVLSKSYRKAGVLFYDGQFVDNAYLFTLLLAAQAQGANFINYLPMVTWKEPGWVEAQDALSGQLFNIRARYVLNCAGYQADELRRKVQKDCPIKLHPSQGIHIAVSPQQISLKNGILLPKTTDGRVIFILPWQDIILIGTTERNLEIEEGNLKITSDEVDFLLYTVNSILDKPISKRDILGFSIGARPLIGNSSEKKTQNLVRSHEIENWPSLKWANVMGGKWTTFRKMAQEAIDLVFKELDIPFVSSSSARLRLTAFIPKPYLQNTSIYPTPMEEIILSENNSSAYLEEIKYWMDFTQASTPEDILERRLMLTLRNIDKAQQLCHLLLKNMNMLDPSNQSWRTNQTLLFEKKLNYYQQLKN
ncbi:MAG: glycerol-3-phosphate dehydrogenase/oxidase [Bacteroidia bacterium]|nr:glycerol-3-phosphate dehydrogenase/oxidase [Bacteroidia bacterium]MDW8158592.1 glycerol-3-phosphate dehydrogenase/oxidase [Bacteroidia bacterium]